jgi:hypothetical protein
LACEPLQTAIREGVAEGALAQQLHRDELEQIATRVRERIEPAAGEQNVSSARERIGDCVADIIRDRLQEATEERISGSAGVSMGITH